MGKPPTGQLPKKVRVPLLSPGGLYNSPPPTSASSGPKSVPSPSPSSSSMTAAATTSGSSLRPQVTPSPSPASTVNPTTTTPHQDAFCHPLRDGETGEPP